MGQSGQAKIFKNWNDKNMTTVDGLIDHKILESENNYELIRYGYL